MCTLLQRERIARAWRHDPMDTSEDFLADRPISVTVCGVAVTLQCERSVLLCVPVCSVRACSRVCVSAGCGFMVVRWRRRRGLTIYMCVRCV